MLEISKEERMLSIVVPVHNAELYLNKCLDSIKNQSFDDYECLLVDDGSTDKSGAICDLYAKEDCRFRVIHQDNAGLVGARITGWCASRGKYIGFVDSDDWIEPDMYAQLVDALENETDADIAITGIIQECEGSSIMEHRRIPEYRVITSRDAMAHMMTRRVFAWELWCKVYRKHLIFEEAFKRGLTVGEDFFTSWHIFTKARRVVCLPSIGYHYRLHPASMSHHRNSRLLFLQSFTEVMNTGYKTSKSLYGYLLTWYMKELGIILIEEILRKRLDDVQADSIQSEINKYIDKLDCTWFDGSWRHLIRFLGVSDGLIRWRNFVADLHRHMILMSKGRKVFIYGAGGAGKIVADILTAWNVEWIGFVVSDGQDVPRELCGKTVMHISQLSCSEDFLFVLGLSSRYVREVRGRLRSLGFYHIYWPLYMRFLTGQELFMERCKDRLLKDVSLL